jgi:hypothetical protein
MNTIFTTKDISEKDTIIEIMEEKMSKHNQQHKAAKELAEKQMSDQKEIKSIKNPNTKSGI